MTSPVTVVFPHANTSGGVERAAAEFLRYQSLRRPASFVGEGTDVSDVRFLPVHVPAMPEGLRPLGFRVAAGRVLRASHGLGTTVSFGANCPPGDVYWVGSVHRAWIERGGQIRFRGVSVPPAVRRVLVRHQVLLSLEADYFRRHRPRAILCTSRQEVEDLSALYDVPRSLMHVVPNGYDAAAFGLHRREADRAAARVAMGVGEHELVVLMVANEWHRKGLGPLIEAVAAAGDPRLRIDLVGRKSPQDYLPLAHRLGLADRLHWHGSTTDAGLFMAGADVFALPTTYEPFGIVIIEAMASGLPVIASRLAGASSAVRHGDNGLLLEDPTDVDEISQALRTMCDDDARARVGALAARSVDAFRWSHVFERADAIIWPEV